MKEMTLVLMQTNKHVGYFSFELSTFFFGYHTSDIQALGFINHTYWVRDIKNLKLVFEHAFVKNEIYYSTA